MRKSKMKKMYEQVISGYQADCRVLEEKCSRKSQAIDYLAGRLNSADKLASFGEYCGRWISIHNPKISATLYMNRQSLHVIIYRNKSVQSATNVLEEDGGLCMMCSITAVMLPVKLYEELDALMLGEYGLMLREDDSALSESLAS